MRALLLAFGLFLVTPVTPAAELSGVFVDDEIQTPEGQTLILNGIGLREKFWVDVYVGSLYLPDKSSDVAEILSTPGPWRLQLDFIYKEVSRDKLVQGWREGFEKNQSAEALKKLHDKIERFYEFFPTSAVARDRYIIDYVPDKGVRVSKNGQTLGLIQGEDFKNAVLEIWLGNYPASKKLKKGMLGL